MKHNKLMSAILLVFMLALAGCPDMVQQDSGSSQSDGSRSSSGGGD
jgi:hypothetical protein